MDLASLIRKAEAKTGRIISSCEITSTGIQNIQFLPYALGDLVLDVWNMKIRLCRVVPAKGGHTFVRLLDENYSEQAEKWLHTALDAAGGFINRSGHYPVVVPIPDWLEPEIAMAVLER